MFLVVGVVNKLIQAAGLFKGKDLEVGLEDLIPIQAGFYSVNPVIVDSLIQLIDGRNPESYISAGLYLGREVRPVLLKGQRKLLAFPRLVYVGFFSKRINEERTYFGGFRIWHLIPEHQWVHRSVGCIPYLEVKVYEDVVPLHSPITIGFDVSKYKPEDREQMFVAKLNSASRPYYSPTQRDGDRLFTEVKNFGTFGLGRDVKAPKVVPVNFRNGQWISNNKDLKVKMWDDLSGIGSYKASVNGKFILMEYEPKESLFTHYFSDGVVTDEENKLLIEVTDNVGNTTIFESTFYRKQ